MQVKEAFEMLKVTHTYYIVAPAALLTAGVTAEEFGGVLESAVTDHSRSRNFCVSGIATHVEKGQILAAADV